MTAMVIHIEQDGTEVGFWAESPDQPCFTAAADTMAEVKQLCREACEIEGWPAPSFTLDPDSGASSSSRSWTVGTAMPERRFQGPWRVEAPEPPGTEDYPGLVVCEGYRRGSIRTKERGLELWCWIYELVTQADWDGVNRDYEPGIDPDEFARFLVNLLNHRGEFGRLVCVLADVERWDVEHSEHHDFEPWWQDRDQRARLRAALLDCVAALDEEEAE